MGLFMKESGKMIRQMVMEGRFILMGIYYV